MAVCQNLVPLVNIKIAGKWMFIPLKMVLIGIDPYPYYIAGYTAGRAPCSCEDVLLDRQRWMELDGTWWNWTANTPGKQYKKLLKIAHL